MEERKIAEILVGKQTVEAAQFFGHMLLRMHQRICLTGNAPIKTFDLRACLEVDNAVVEKFEGFVAYLLCIVPVFEHGAGRKVVPYFGKVLHQLVVVFGGFEILRHLRLRGHIGDFEHKHTMVRRERAAAFGYYVRMGYSVFVCHVDKRIHAIVDIFLNGIVYRTFAVTRPCAVVIDSETASAVDKLNVEAHGMKLHIKLRSLAQGRLYAPYFGYLASDMKMYQFQTVFHSETLQYSHSLEQFARVKSELACIASAFGPFAGTRSREFYANAYLRAYAQFPRGLENSLEFIEFFGYEEHFFPHFLCQQREFDVALVFMPVAYYQAVGVHVCGQHGMQFGFRAGLKSYVVAFAVADYFFHHGAHLVYFYGIYNEMVAIEVVFFRCLLEAGCRFFYTVVEDIGKPQQYGSGDVA